MAEYLRVDRFVYMLFRQVEGRTSTKENAFIEKQLAENDACKKLYENVQETFLDDFIELLVRRYEGLTSHSENLYIEKQLRQNQLCRELWEDAQVAFEETFPKRLLRDMATHVPRGKTVFGRWIASSLSQIVDRLIQIFSKFFLVIITLTVALLLMSVVKFFNSKRKVLSTLSISGLSKSVVLELGDGKYLNLTTNSRLNYCVDGVSITSHDDTLVLTRSAAAVSKGWCQLNVPAGRTCKVKLLDGSFVHLGPKTRLRFCLSFKDEQREVYMDGEAFFNVAASTEHSFSIQVPDVKIQALSGSIVHVQNYGRNLEASIIEGIATMYRNDEYVYVMPGRTLLFDRATDQLQTRKARTNWLTLRREGTYVVSGRPLAEVCELIERLYDVKIVLDDRAHSDSSCIAVVSGKRHLGDFLKDLCARNKLAYYTDKNQQIHIDDIP